MLHEKEKRSTAKPYFSLALVYCGIHLIVIFIIGRITAFAPDEEYYLNLLSNIYKSEFTRQSIEGYSTDNLFFLRLIYSPAKILTIMGLDELISLRVNSMVTSLFSMLLLVRMSGEARILKFRQKNWIIFGFMIPSVVLWTSLGLRESFIFLFLITFFFFLNESIGKLNFRNILGLLVSSTSLAYTKNYLQLIIAVSLILAICSYCVLNRHLTLKCSIIVLLFLAPNLTSQELRDISLGNLKTISTKFVNSSDRMVEKPQQSVRNDLEGKKIVDEAFSTSHGQTIDLFLKQYHSNKLVSAIVKQVYRSNNDQKNGISNANESDFMKQSHNGVMTQLTPASFSNPETFIFQVIALFFRPAPFRDNGSPALNLLSYESFVWYPFYLLLFVVVLLLFRRHVELSFGIWTVVLFLLGTLLQACFFEVNLGTAYRHRTIFLIGTLILLAQLRGVKGKQSYILEF